MNSGPPAGDGKQSKDVSGEPLTLTTRPGCFRLYKAAVGRSEDRLVSKITFQMATVGPGD